MKFLILIGGLAGFSMGLFFSWVQENTWPTSLWHASAAAYLTSLLMRWWGGSWRKNLEAALRERQSIVTQTSPLSNSLSKASKP